MKKLSILSYSMGSGGAERVIFHLLPMLMKEYEVYLFLVYNDIHYPIPESVVVESLYPDASNRNLRALRSISEGAAKYERFIKKYQIDISLSFTFRPNIINGIVKKRIGGLRCIMSERDYPGGLNDKSWLSNFVHGLLRTRYYNCADLIISNSLHINQALWDNYKVNRPMVVIYNPVMLPDRLADVRTESNALKIVSVGQLSPLKNHMMILKAVLSVPSASLTILGEGRQRSRYEEFVRMSGLGSRVSMPGKQKDVYKYLRDADVFVLSSNTEGFPNALLEAMSVGLPVISTNCLSGPLEMLNDNLAVSIEEGSFVQAEYGLLIGVNDEVGLAEALRFYSDPNARVQLAQKARQRAESYALDKIVGQYISAISGNIE